MGRSLAIEREEVQEHSCCCCNGGSSGHGGAVIAMAKVPKQKWSEPYDLATALKQGTIFPELDKPFYMGGDDDVR